MGAGSSRVDFFQLDTTWDRPSDLCKQANSQAGLSWAIFFQLDSTQAQNLVSCPSPDKSTFKLHSLLKS